MVIISHNREFADAVSQERWIMEADDFDERVSQTLIWIPQVSQLLNPEKKQKTMGQRDYVKERFDVSEMTEAVKASKLKDFNRRLRKLRKNAEQNEPEIYDLEEKIMLLQQ